MNVALSTLSMSAVNVLAMHGATSRQKLEEAIAMHYNFTAAQIAPAIDEAIARGLVIVDGEVLKSILPGGYAVRDRDRGSEGWDGWVAKNITGQTIKVSDLIGGA